MTRLLPALVLGLAGLAAATSVVPLRLEEMAHASERVVHARAEASWAQWNPERTLIYTYTRFRVLETLKGKPAGSVVVRRMGGRADGYVQRISGVRGWTEGEEVVLFLRRKGGVFTVTGLLQGDFRVRREGDRTLVSNGVPGVRSLERDSGRVGAYRGERMSLEELKARVREAR